LPQVSIYKSARLALAATLGAVTVAAAFAISYASATTQINRIRHSNFYDRATIRTAAVGGLRATIYGSPTETATPEEIAAALELPSGVGRKGVVAIDPDTPRDGPRLILVFNPHGVVDWHVACTSPEKIAGGKGSGSLFVYGVMCQSDHPYAQAQLTNSGVTGLGPPFTMAMRQLFLAMFPRENPELRRDGDRR